MLGTKRGERLTDVEQFADEVLLPRPRVREYHVQLARVQPEVRVRGHRVGVEPEARPGRRDHRPARQEAPARERHRQVEVVGQPAGLPHQLRLDLDAAGGEVEGREAHRFDPNGVNDHYLETKARRFGHLLG